MKPILLKRAEHFVNRHTSHYNIAVDFRDLGKNVFATAAYLTNCMTNERIQGLITLNELYWENLSPCCRLPILLHEVGHIETGHKVRIGSYKGEVYAHAWAKRSARKMNWMNAVQHLDAYWDRDHLRWKDKLQE